MKSAHRLQGTEPRAQRHWDWRAAINFIAGGAGGGLLFLAAAMQAAIDVQALFLTAGALIATGLASVWLEIGRPGRALNVLRHLGRSWMSREAAFAVLLLACLAFALLSGHGLAVLAAGALGAAFLYSQARILSADKGIPAWRHPRCRMLMVITGLAEGAGLLGMHATASAGSASPAGSALLLIVLLLLVFVVARAWVWRSYLGVLRQTRAPQGSLRALDGISLPFLVVGAVLPAALAGAALVATFVAAAEPTIAGLVSAAGVFTVAAGWLMKYVLITRAGFTETFTLQHIPVRGRRAPAAARGNNPRALTAS